MKLGRSGIVLLLAGAMLATSASIAGAWLYSTEEVEYEGSPYIIGTHTGQTYIYRVGVATNESADPDTLEELENEVRQCLISMAVFVGRTRLIDNVVLGR